jgi:hypothetical protein
MDLSYFNSSARNSQIGTVFLFFHFLIKDVFVVIVGIGNELVINFQRVKNAADFKDYHGNKSPF